MNLFPEPLSFSWDQGNIDKNLLKHHVTTSEAEELFSTEPLVVRYDAKHFASESRYQALGKTKNGRKLFVAFTIRDKQVRVISIRDMTEREEKAYERTEENS
jgi:uncharacterized DUF497 family protein